MSSTFTVDEVVRLPGPGWLSEYRTAAFEQFANQPLPSGDEDVWRYFPIAELDLDAYRPAGVPAGIAGPGAGTAAAGAGSRATGAGVAEIAGADDAGAPLGAAEPGAGTGAAGAGFPPASSGSPATTAVADGLGSRQGALVDGLGAAATTRNGWVATVPPAPLAGGARLEPAGRRADGRQVLDQVLDGGDPLVQLNHAYAPDALVLEVPAGTVLAEPVVIVHQVDGAPAGPAPAAFPRLVVQLGAGAVAQVVEVLIGAAGSAGALVVPVTELSVADGALLDYVSMQLLGIEAWHVGRLAGQVGQDARLRLCSAGLGAGRDRLRTDVVATGRGGTTESCAVYLGTGSQVHDVRTLQDHAAPHTTSDLLCQGVVTDRARSIYTGLIRVRRDAVRSDAQQRNRNLVLGEHAHADSVPNLDIQENDVRCSHASTVGPPDPEQQYYLESRGVPPTEAERLIVRGFFRQALARCPVPVAADHLAAEVERRLAASLGRATTGG